MEKKNLSVNSNNILPIIKTGLYSEKDIFLRELISNACDAINKMKIINLKESSSSKSLEERIDVSIDKTKKIISITDNGIGMTKDELEKYICQIAFSGAEEFVEKHKDTEQSDKMIGFFGLGFYSAYMVAQKVEIETTSYQNDKNTVLWSCDGSSEYEIKELEEKKQQGTKIILHINEESLSFLEEITIKKILQRHCLFIQYPIYLNEKHINNKDPLWIKKPQDITDKEYIEFYKTLYPFEQEPVFWIHLNIDYPFNLKGILYFPKIQPQIDLNKNCMQLFCNRVFVSDNCKGVFPDFLTVLRGAIDSIDLPLNVSRSFLQKDHRITQLSNHISKKINDKLNSLYISDKAQFTNIWNDIEVIIKLGVLQNEKFYEKAKSFLIFKTTKDEWITAEEYITRNEKAENIYYVNKDYLGSSILKIFEDKNIDVLIMNQYIDSAIINYLESKLVNKKFKRIDSELNSTLLDKTKEKSLLGTDGKSEASKIASLIKDHLDIDNMEVEAKSLDSQDINGFLMTTEEERRLKDYMDMSSPQNQAFNLKKTFVVNTNSKLIQNYEKLALKDPELSKIIIRHIYELSLLSQKELDANEFNSFINRSNNILDQLISKNLK